MSQGIPLALEEPEGASPLGADPVRAGPEGASGAVPRGRPGFAAGAKTLGARAADVLRRYGGAWVVWLILGVLVAVPVGAFLLQTFMPRLFGQGSSWFTLSAFGDAFQRPPSRPWAIPSG
jgi:hypothetical protein